MHNCNQKIYIEITAGALILCAAMILILPIQWLIAAVLAAMFHELCHGLTTILLGGKIESVTIGGRGAVMKATLLSAPKEIVASLAGPVGSLSLLLLAKWMPRTAICGLVHGIYNLIPLIPLDGGRILRGIIYCILPPPGANKLFIITQRFFTLCICILCCIFAGKMSFMIMVLLIFLFCRHRRQITLAKRSFWRYNRDTIKEEVRL